MPPAVFWQGWHAADLFVDVMGVADLEQGIAALRAGKRAEARLLLTAVVAADEGNEQAWLWLSRAVDTAAERRTCLEKVLVLNPQSDIAQQGLAQLDGVGHVPESAARVAASTPSREVVFEDVLSRTEGERRCAYCAQPLGADERECEHCGQTLRYWRYRYDKPSVNFHIYWVLILGLSQLFLVQVSFDMAAGASPVQVLAHGVMGLLFLVLALALYRRLFWGYVFSLMGLVLAGGLVVGLPFWAGYTAASGVIRMLQYVVLGTAFVVGVFMARADFAREWQWWLVQVDEGLSSASGLFMVGDRYAKRGMWGTAVAHWQRAVADDPARLLYQLSLAQGYAKIAQYERGLDVLQSARQVATTDAGQAKVAELKRTIEAEMKQKP